MSNSTKCFNTMCAALRRIQNYIKSQKVIGIEIISRELYRNNNVVVRLAIENNIIVIKAFGYDVIMDIDTETYKWTGSVVGAFRLTAEIVANWESIKKQISNVIKTERESLETQLSLCEKEMKVLTNFTKEKYDAKF